MENDVKSDERRKVEEALKLFPYFETWSETTISDCCRLSKVKVAPPDCVVLGSDDSGAHFIVDGICKLIEHLAVGSVAAGKNPAVRVKTSDVSVPNEPRYSSLLFNMDPEPEVVMNEQPTCQTMGEKSSGNNVTEAEEDKCQVDVKDEEKDAEPVERDVTQGKFYKFYSRMLPHISEKKKHVPFWSNTAQSHFLQIALVHKGFCLGLGENLQNRFLVSVTEVTYMVIPLQFLLRHNPNNIWNRIKQFLNYYLPSEDRVLDEFHRNRKWTQDKLNLVRSISPRNLSQLSDVPRSIRLTDFNSEIYAFRRGLVGA